MPIGKESFYPSDWFKKAEGDFKRVQARLKEGDLEDAAFHLQQAMEKGLKGFLLSRGWRLKKIHDLEALLDDAVRYQPSLGRFRELLQTVTGYYLIERYPAFEKGPTRSEIVQASQQARSLLTFIRTKIKSGKQ